MSKNTMICDLETGVCGVAGDEKIEVVDFKQSQEKIELYYFTDPICSHCWALEPVLNKFMAQYGHYVNMHTVMGGLLKSWDGFADVKNGIAKASDVASHWKEVGEHSRIPIDGSLWIHNPIHSSYPASRVYKIIQQSSQELAHDFLRKAREAVFVWNQNIGEDQVLVDIVSRLNLDGEEIIKEAGSDLAKELLDEDFNQARKLGVRGFPTMIMMNAQNQAVKIVGARSLEDYLDGLRQVLLTTDEIQAKPVPAISDLLESENRLFTKEIEVMYNIDKEDAHVLMRQELETGQVEMKEILGEHYLEKSGS